MKIILSCLLVVLFGGIVFAQSPQKMSYQAVVRKSDNKLLVNSPVGVRISILQTSINGIVVYAERHTASTNDNGLVTFEIGSGKVTQGNLATLNWSAGPYFIKTEYDPNGGTSYSITSITQLLSVPYALFAEKSGGNFIHHIGELFGGGVIFYLYKDKNGQEHGLIVGLEDLSPGIGWSNLTEFEIGDAAKSTWNGRQNTTAIINQPGHFESAAQVCEESISGGQTDWYLPSLDELNLLYNARYEVNRSLDSDNDPSTLPLNYYDYYWSSTEAKNYSAWTKHFGIGYDNTNGKPWQYAVRAVRSF